MKKIMLLMTMLFAAAVINLVQAQCPGFTVYGNWDATVLGISNAWGGTTTSVVADPDAGQTDNALLISVGADEYGWAGATTDNLGGYINLDECSSITLDVFPTTQGDLLVQLNDAYGINWGIELSIDSSEFVLNQWNRITFDFTAPGVGYCYPNQGEAFDYADVTSGKYNVISFLPNAGIALAGDWYFDNISGPSSMSAPCYTCLSDLTVGGTTVAGFDPNVADYTVVLPEPSAAYPTVAGTAQASNATVTVVDTFAAAIPGQVSIDVVSLSGIAKTYIVFFVYERILPLDAEMGSYALQAFDGGFIVDTVNVVSGGINTSANVFKIGKAFVDPGYDVVWGGGLIHLTSPIDFNSGVNIFMKVYSPRAGVPILLRLEGYNGEFAESLVNTTVANEWEILSFDFLYPTGGTTINNVFQKVFIMPDFGSVGQAPAEVFYVDDIMQWFYIACPTDVDGSGTTGGGDILEIISNWGAICE